MPYFRYREPKQNQTAFPRGVLLRIRIPKNLTQQAYSLIRKEIVQGGLDDHPRLTEEQFAKRFGISKSPIREALTRLEAEGLITILPRRGAFIPVFSKKDVEEIYELREILESRVVRNLKLDEKTAARLRAAVDRADACYRENDRDGYVRADMSFHRILAEANPNARLRKALENMHDQMLILRRRTFALTGGIAPKQHRAILDALERGEQNAAERLMIEHIRIVRDRLLEHSAKPSETAAPAAPSP
jgi:DNA-binding GntR family transcriptional regulator